MKALYKLLLAVSLVWSFGLQAQTVYNFTTCGANGPNGPTQAQVNATYTSGNTLNGAVTINTQGIQEWTVPATGTYRIEAYGAEGGHVSGYALGGKGAKMQGEFFFTAGQVIKVAVGQRGAIQSIGYNSPGGGGSFVYSESPSVQAYVIAGGGGGASRVSTVSSRVNATTSTTGQAGTNADGSGLGSSGGTGGQRGNYSTSNSYPAGPGGGWLTGNPAATHNNCSYSYSPEYGGGRTGNFVGGDGGSAWTGAECGGAGICIAMSGGFGGGGGVSGACGTSGSGGGGGYSGGGVGDNCCTSSGGGGGSYNAGSNQANLAATNSGDGKVIITKLYFVDVTQTASINCNGDNTAALTAAAGGGNSPYTYAWSTGATTASITGLTAGTYTVTATDASSAITTNSFTITEPTALVVSSSITNASCNGGTDGAIAATVTGGTSPYTYSWSNGSTTASNTGLAAGTYSVTVTDQNGCTTTTSPAVTEPGVGAAVLNGTNLSCFADNSGAVSIQTADTTNYSYTGSAQTYTVPAGVTSIVIETWGASGGDAIGAGGNGGYATGTLAVTPGQQLNIYVGGQGAATGGGSLSNSTDGGFNGGGAGGGDPNWGASGGGASDVRVGGTALTNRVIVAGGGGGGDNPYAGGHGGGTVGGNSTNDNGLVASSGGTQAAGGVPAPMQNTAQGAAGTLGFGGNNASWSSSGHQYGGGGGGGYYGGGGGHPWASGGGGSSYIGGVTSASTIAGNASMPNYAGGTMTGNDGHGYVRIIIPGQTYTSYSWSTGATTPSLSGLAAGTYSVTVTATNGCISEGSATITQPSAALASSAALTSALDCNGDTDGQATASATGGTSPYTYSWSNGATSSIASGLGAGTYSVTLTDQNGCTDSSSLTITEPTLLVAASVVDSNVSCNSGTDGGATASATGGTSPYTYSWSNGATTASISGVAAGTYTATVTDANGCTSTTSSTITEPTLLVAASAVDSNVSCNSGTDGGATASATGGTMPYTYAWSNGATTASITGAGAGTYTATVTDANGCTSSTSATVTEPAVLVAASTVDANVSCNGGSNGGATASATGGTTPYAYAWSNGATTATITGVVAGTYTATVTDANGCTSTTSSTITEPAALVASSSVDANVSCNGLSNGGATASATGGTTPYTYAWSNGATTATITGVAAGTYTATVTDANGCTSTASSTISEPALLVAASVVDSNVSCNSLLDGGATASATGGTAPYTYAWSNGATTASITGVAAGTYTATVTDANGCTSTSSSTVTEPTVLVAASAVDSNVSCNGGTDGGATASATGGTTPYAYLWSNGATTASITGVAAGTYTATITDANGCTSTSSSTVTEPTLLVASSVVDANVTCNGGMDGAATASATGGTTVYTFAWSNGATTASVTGLAAGTYTATVTDANGCSTTITATVTEPAPLPATVMIDSNVTCNGGMNGGATASVSGGTSPYTYLWNNGATTASITGLAAGVYSTTVTDANGCLSNGSDTITEPTAITLMDSTIMPLCNGDSNGSAYVMSMGGTGVHTYAWSNGSMVDSIANAGAGTYTVSVTDANGCEVPFTVTINEPTVLSFNIDDVKDTKCEFGTTGFVKTTTFGGTAPYYYAWSNTDTVEDAYNLGAGMYYLTVTDTNGCTAVDSAYVDYINDAPVFTIQGKDTACFGEVNNLSVLGVAGWNWSTGSTTASTAADTTGTYSVTVTDHLGCENFGSFDVYVNAAIELNVAATDANCEFGTNGSAVATATGGSSNFEYAWSTGANTASADLAIGTHEVMVTDMIGCQDSAEVVIGFVNENPTIAFPADTTVCEKTVFTLDPGVAGGTYMWNTGDTTSTIEVSMAGTYGVALTDANGCGAEDSVVVNYDNCNGVEEGQAISMAVYPNPSRGMFNVSLNGYAGSVELSVLDITGKQVMNAQRVVTNNEVIELDLDQAAGVYFLRLNITDKTLYKQLIIE